MTVADGDEPVAALDLYNFARELSFDVISIGKGKNNPFDTFATPSSLTKEASLKQMNPKMLTSFVDGTKTMVEMSALANFLGFNIDIDGMHGIEATYENIISSTSRKKMEAYWMNHKLLISLLELLQVFLQ